MIYAQNEIGAVGLDVPVRNSMMFNRFEVNPTFSFVREQTKYISVTNKREHVQIEEAPQTYLLNYSGRFGENIGSGIGVFQQNYGVFTTFGGMVNFAYNVRIQEESNLTFGINIGAYQSGVNAGKVITNSQDPALENVPSNFLLTANPGLNYGTGFMDFGVSLNNVVTYNFSSSGLIEENPKQGIQGHIMYTGYTGGYGFFGDSRFSALVRTELQKETTVFSGVFMLTVPKGIWAQVGYNTIYGASGGLGVNITSQIAIEYNYEKPFMGLTDLGPAHEITLAYRFKNSNYYDYSRDDDLAGLISLEKKRKPIAKKAVAKTTSASETTTDLKDETIAIASEEQATLKAEEATRIASEEQARLKAAEATRIASEEQARLKAEEATRIASQEQTRLKAEAASRIASEEQARLKAEEATRIASEEQARLKTQEAARIASEEQARLKAEEAVRIVSEEQARLKAAEAARIASEEQARLKAEEAARIASEEQARLKAEEATRIASEEQARLKAEEATRIASEAQARLKAEEAARIASEEQARLKTEKNSIENLIENPIDEIGKSIRALAIESEASKLAQTELLTRLETAVVNKKLDLKDLKEENDLSEQNIYVEPKPFKSISEENRAIETLIINLDTVLLRQKKKIAQLESLLETRVKSMNNPSDELNGYYINALTDLKTEQDKVARSRETLISSLKQIAVATEFERKRRIKRAAFDNEMDRYAQDRSALKRLRQSVSTAETPLTKDDFDYGKEGGKSIQILKNVENTESAYYLVLAVHSELSKRNEFLTQVIASGYKDVDFFYDVNTSKYYIYSKKASSIDDVNRYMKTKESAAYNENMSVIKIEN
ncbi:type IX secretion system PorP/SprF family membrane protein [Ulvibacter antarcticus]|uniref:Type IX secretion system PorP/SprF family membrane protein n=2 Tax=Ulvibacter antarcticus TaxID=442714 RepID=A0A3L9Z246_9FLAO|nr:type IX secretion system PorP/SprF family membrane protein [Ulvibacter antarcticus]